MPINIRRSLERGQANLGWLKSFHTFSFGDYYDPNFMGFGALRVINDDTVSPGEGFGRHPHRDMEILTYVVSGQLKHQDSMGHEALINPSEVQKISAGSGIYHSEFNPSSTKPVHFYQIWIAPNEKGVTPSYQQMSVANYQDDGLVLLASPEKADNVIHLLQEVKVYKGILSKGNEIKRAIKSGHLVWIQLMVGELSINGISLSEGDAVGVEKLEQLTMKAFEPCEFLYFELA